MWSLQRSDVKDNPVNVQDRVKKNIQEGRVSDLVREY